MLLAYEIVLRNRTEVLTTPCAHPVHPFTIDEHSFPCKEGHMSLGWHKHAIAIDMSLEGGGRASSMGQRYILVVFAAASCRTPVYQWRGVV